MTDHITEALREDLNTAIMAAWSSWAIVCDHSQSVPIGTLVDAVMSVLEQHDVVIPETVGEPADGSFADQIDAYRAVPYIDGDGHPAIALRCPDQGCTEDHAADEAPGPVSVGTLFDLAALHSAGDDDPGPCHIVDLPGIGPTRVQGDLEEQGATYLAEIVTAAQRKMAEDSTAKGGGDLRDQLAAMRARWDDRRKIHEQRLETSDGGARTAAVCRDICAHVLDELDQLLTQLPAQVATRERIRTEIARHVRNKVALRFTPPDHDASPTHYRDGAAWVFRHSPADADTVARAALDALEELGQLPRAEAGR